MDPKNKIDPINIIPSSTSNQNLPPPNDVPSPQDISLVFITEDNELEKRSDIGILNENIEQNATGMIEQNAKALFEYARKNVNLLKNWNTLSSGATEPVKDVVDQVNRFIDPIVKYKTKIENEQMPRLESISNKLDMVGSIFNFHQLLNQTGCYIYRRSLLNTVENELNKFKQNLKNTSIPNDVQELENWLIEQKDILKKEGSSITIGTFAMAPTVVKILAEKFMNVGEKFKLGNSAAAGLVGIFFKALSVHGARKDRKTHVDHTEGLKDPTLPKGEIERVKIEKRTEVIHHFEEIHEHANKLLIERQNARKSMDKDYKESFGTWFEKINKLTNFEEIKKSCEENGIFLKEDFNIKNLKEFQYCFLENNQVLFIKEKGAFIKTEPIIDGDLRLSQKENLLLPKDVLLEKYIDHKETMAVATRQHLLAPVRKMVQQKHNVERKFLNFNLASSSIALTASLIVYVATIVLKTLALVAIIATPTVILAWAGLGVFALGLVLTLAGILLLRHYRPNLFSELIRGTQAKISLYNIPLTIQKLRLDLVEMKKSKMIWKEQTTISSQEGSSKKELNTEDLDKKIKVLQESIEKWEKKIDPLQQRLKEASWKDFQKSANLTSKNSESAQSLKDLKLDDNLINAFLNDEHFFDEKTKKFFEKHLGISLNTLKEMSRDMKKEIFNKMKDFFSLTEKELVKFIASQQQKNLQES